MSSDDRLIPFGLAGLGLVLIAIGVFLPLWDEGSVSAFSGISENSLLQSGYGWVTLLLAGSCVVSLVRAWQKPRRIYWPLVSGVLVIGSAVYNGTSEDVMTLCPLDADAVSDLCQVAEPGIGVYAVGLGGAALLASGIFFLRLPPSTEQPSTHVSGKITRECPFCKSQIPPRSLGEITPQPSARTFPTPRAAFLRRARTSRRARPAATRGVPSGSMMGSRGGNGHTRSHQSTPSSTTPSLPCFRSETPSRRSSAARTPSAWSKTCAATIPSSRATCGSRSASSRRAGRIDNSHPQ